MLRDANENSQKLYVSVCVFGMNEASVERMRVRNHIQWTHIIRSTHTPNVRPFDGWYFVYTSSRFVWIGWGDKTCALCLVCSGLSDGGRKHAICQMNKEKKRKRKKKRKTPSLTYVYCVCSPKISYKYQLNIFVFSLLFHSIERSQCRRQRHTFSISFFLACSELQWIHGLIGIHYYYFFFSFVVPHPCRLTDGWSLNLCSRVKRDRSHALTNIFVKQVAQFEHRSSHRKIYSKLFSKHLQDECVSSAMMARDDGVFKSWTKSIGQKGKQKYCASYMWFGIFARRSLAGMVVWRHVY